jgi:hypothetical protein
LSGLFAQRLGLRDRVRRRRCWLKARSLSLGANVVRRLLGPPGSFPGPYAAGGLIMGLVMGHVCWLGGLMLLACTARLCCRSLMPAISCMVERRGGLSTWLLGQVLALPFP